MPGRHIDPHQQPDQHLDRRGGVPSRRDITGDHRKLERHQERKGIEVQTDDTNVIGRWITKLRFRGIVTAEIVGDAAEIGIDATPTSYLTTDVDLSGNSGQFVIEDDAITDEMIVFAQHVGLTEEDDEPEMDGILCVPNPPANGSVVVNWQACPGPVSGSRAVRYWFASAG